MSSLLSPGVAENAGILPPKGIGTPPLKKPICEERGLIKDFKSGIRVEDFVLMGGGEPGEKCGVQAISKIHPFGVSVCYEPLRCKRVECPDCAPYEMTQKAKAIAYKIECYAQAHGVRPHAMVMSVKPQVEAGWDWNNFEMNLFRRGYRRAQKLGVVGGVGIGHPFRLKKGILELLKAEGIKSGFWSAVKNDVLGLGSWREYVKFGYHEHSIGFPGYFDQHEDKDFVIKKYTVLQDLESVVKHVMYLLGHSGVLKSGSGSKDSIRWWGVLNGNSKAENAYREEDLPLKQREKIRSDIDRILDNLDGVKDKEKRVVACPVTGMDVDKFFPIRMLPVLLNDRVWRESVCDENGDAKGCALLADLEKLADVLDEKSELFLEDCLKLEFEKLVVFGLEIPGG